MLVEGGGRGGRWRSMEEHEKVEGGVGEWRVERSPPPPA